MKYTPSLFAFILSAFFWIIPQSCIEKKDIDSEKIVSKDQKNPQSINSNVVVDSLTPQKGLLGVKNAPDNKKQNSQPQLLTVEEVDARIAKALKAERDPYDKFFTQLEGINGTFALYLNYASIFFAAVGIIFLWFQIRVSSQENTRMNEINAAYKASIDSTTSFIGSYEQLIKVKETAEEIRIKQAEEEKRLTKLRIEKQTDLNGKAMRLVNKDVFASNYGSTFFSDDAISSFRNFSIEATTAIAFYEGDKDAERHWNGYIYFLMALNQFLEKQPNDTKKYIDKAIEKANESIGAMPSADEIAVLFPKSAKYDEIGDIDVWNRKLQSLCYFYQGQNYYRWRLDEHDEGLGFRKAAEAFRYSLAKSPENIDAIFFMFQANLWGKQFDSIEKLTNDMKEMLESALKDHPKIKGKTKQVVEARMYMKLGDFYRKNNVGVEEAITYYSQSYNLLKALGENIPEGYRQIAPISYFGFANVIMAAKEAKIEPKLPEGVTENSLLRSALEAAENECNLVGQKIENRETRYILFYILAKCQQKLNIDSKDVLNNIDEAVKAFKEFCSHNEFYGYSPISNSMLLKAQIESEIRDFKKTIETVKA